MDKRRYFLLTYYIEQNPGYSIGNQWFEANGLPSNKEMRKRISESVKGATADKVIITNIYEFKNKEDYESFCR